MIECLNLYLPDQYIYAFIHQLFKAYPCCKESYDEITEYAMRQKKRLQSEGKKESFVHPRLMMRKTDYIPLRHDRTRVIIGGKFTRDLIEPFHDRVNDIIVAHSWENDNPFSIKDIDDLIDLDPQLPDGVYQIDLCGISPQLIETIRISNGHHGNQLIADYNGNIDESHTWAEWHTIWLNTYAAYVMTTAFYMSHIYSQNKRDYRFMIEIWETIIRLARLKADMDGSNAIKKCSDEIFALGILPIIHNS